ncbi:MAG: CtsR family transcriptional regulator, partial [Oscillospiraceae bacterium]|nr:CtsR family transcriptional regulator [Oscillospiraceae bacterium]
VINTIGDELDYPSARAILGNLLHAGALEERTAKTLLAAVGDKSLNAAPKEVRDRIRADILKNTLILQV